MPVNFLLFYYIVFVPSTLESHKVDTNEQNELFPRRTITSFDSHVVIDVSTVVVFVVIIVTHTMIYMLQRLQTWPERRCRSVSRSDAAADFI